MKAEVLANGDCKGLLTWRMFLGIATSIAVQFLFMSCVLFLVNFRMMHPLLWILNTWSTVTSPRTWSYFLILATVIFIQGIICGKKYLNAPTYQKSRFSVMCHMFKPNNLLVGALHLLVGAILVWLHLSLADGRYSSMIVRCPRSQYCLVEEHFFLILSGIWTGFYFFLKSNFSRMPLWFPIIPISRFRLIKRGIRFVAPIAALKAIWPTIYFIVLYYFLGGYCRDVILSMFAIYTKAEPLDTIYGLFNLTLAFYTWLFTALFLLTMDTMHLCFEAHLTKRVMFEIEQRNLYDVQDPGITLSDAMGMDKIPIIQHLAYLDLFTLAPKEKTRRSILFTLSTPGCRPCNWNSVASKCINMLTKFTLDIDEACSTQFTPVSLQTSVLGKPFENPYYYKMRNLAAMNVGFQASETVVSKHNGTREQPSSNFLKNKRDQFVNWIFTKPFVKYIFQETIQNKIQHIFLNGHPVIWAMEGISTLIIISLKEDQYGVIQQDLPQIIKTLLALKDAVDKLHRTNLFVKKSQNDDKDTRIMLTYLRTSVKRCIYRITTRFEYFIADLNLEPETVAQLQSFLSYKE